MPGGSFHKPGPVVSFGSVMETKLTSADLLRAAEAKADEMCAAGLNALCVVTGFKASTLHKAITNAFMEGAVWHKRELEAR